MTTEMKSAAPQQDSPENPNASAGEPDAAADVNDTKETPEGDADLLRRVFGVLLRRSLIFSVLLVAAAVTIGALAWYLHSSQRSEQQARAALTSAREATSARQRAEQIALDYSRGAAEMDFKDIPGWTKRLTTNTSPELTKKLKDAAASMEQIVVPLQWVSTPTPITSAVRSERDGIYVVNSFLSVMTKNVQAPNGVQSTATYTVTINAKDNWVITDVGGVDSAMRAGK
ncbi:hypothetical protein [Mycobacteroides immunogenum]|uniref:hypothetical protein n=1 Tax=Mycobacteroides immunogenum TaxID=83262 RepID=UPI00157DFD43|nr:hypothetical protein [Mycobacteroides immunogenum]MCV7307083.1 hypothetical protein [Mycobacteroides immunogenum]